MSDSVIKRPLRLLITQSLNHSITLLWLFSQIAEACPACKEALFDPGQLHQKLSAAQGYALSIIVLLSVPALLIAGVTALMVREMLKGRRARSLGGPPHAIDTPEVSR